MEVQKTVGIIRRMDDLGRVVIPKEMRDRLCIRDGDSVEFIQTADGIFFRKYDGAGGLRNLMELLRAALLETDPWEGVMYKLAALECEIFGGQETENQEGRT